ncbi:bifunctional helix-turn-helix transcriptional regulator/GNAT family N-acetyltransferase [Bdellovibrio reynosensis]|uniref:Helix-turn-helix domain-containing GNAT family N-acetyltransferase n=1 Tax=Bdellovibrio reynosensis TaxID=2835041 RepID=A0ABY4CEZ6_9BACT|nr:bifunctional helix-turn-helix transcriptional regulator/GNAT family N-acetyltransferase [Bdellovibrio reynosensis]UOF02462.1 helix-turn-helix domain-containing GNAT family N-acetyltransferase [Bdellovibrio reynosensis]
MKFFDQVGKMAMGTRIRFLGDKITQDAAQIYKVYDNALQPKWFPVFYVLSSDGESTVTAIAEYIGHSHASVSKILAEMSKAGLVLEKTDPKDRRKTKISLSKKGKEIANNISDQFQDVGAAIEEISAQTTHNLWAAIEEWEYFLAQKSLLERVIEKKKQRESISVKIESYKPKYKEAFFKLNEEWISKYFKMEQPDRDALGNPKGYILDKGGAIFVATLNGEPVGVCALIKRDDLNCFELAKMAVSPKAQGKNIGYLLGKACIEKAEELKTDRLFLESNTILKPAIRLYEKLGFKKVVGPPTPYERCNIQMELRLNTGN